MQACIVLHNMIVEDEWDGYTQYDVSYFAHSESTSSPQVDFTYSTDMPSNLGNMIATRTRLRDRTKHEKLKADLLNIYGKDLVRIKLKSYHYSFFSFLYVLFCFNVTYVYNFIFLIIIMFCQIKNIIILNFIFVLRN